MFKAKLLFFFFGMVKNDCSEGLYGESCSQQCKGHCRDGTTCNHVTSQCDGGYGSGWTGSLCDKDIYGDIL